MKWIRGGSSGWHRDWVKDQARQQFDLYEEDRTGEWWFDLASGNELALVVDGGWRMIRNGHDYDARYRVFFYDGGRVVEITEAMLAQHSTRGRLDKEEAGASRYVGIRDEAVRLVHVTLTGEQLLSRPAVAPEPVQELQGEQDQKTGLRGVFGLRRRRAL